MLSSATPRRWLAALRWRSHSERLKSKRDAVVMLRWLLIIAAAYLMLFSAKSEPGLGVSAMVILLLISNVVVARLPEELVDRPGFDVVLLLTDTIALSTGFYLTGRVSSDFYLLYFFVVFLAGVSERLSSVLMGSALVSAAYLSMTWAGPASVWPTMMQGSVLLHVYFIFAVALFYGFLVERIRVDRQTQQAQYVARLEGLNGRLQEVAELKRAFIGAVSHELRTPLNGLLGYIDIVRGEEGETSRGTVRTYLDRAYERGLHLMRLIEELLSFSNISKGHIRVHRMPTDVQDLIEHIRAAVDVPAQAKGIALHCHVDRSVGQILTDGEKLHQVLLHLVSNAVKFTEQGEVRVGVTQRSVTLTSGWTGMVLECCIDDTGPGISPEQREVIFEEFRQLDGSTTRRHGGMGLGLTVCRGLVQLLRGEIHVDGVLGRGTTFIVRVPTEHVSEIDSEAPPSTGAVKEIPETRRALRVAAR